MKTSYTNAEKVSDHFINLRYNEFHKRLDNYNKAARYYIVLRFLEKLDEIYKCDLDNYEKLKAFIRLEREFEEYLRSKAVLFEIIKYELNVDFMRDMDDTQSEKSIETIVEKSSNIVKMFLNFSQELKEWIFTLLDNSNEVFEHYVNPNEVKTTTLSDYLHKNYLVFEKENHFADIIKSLTEEDISWIKDSLLKYLRVVFNYAVKHNRPIVDLFERFKYQNIIIIAREFLSEFWANFRYSDDITFAKSFKETIIEATKSDVELLRFAQNNNFWQLILGAEKFYESSFEGSQNESVEESAIIELHKVTDLKSPLLKTPLKVLIDLDLRGLNLSEFDFSGYTIINCNLEGTNAKLDFESLNLRSSVYYVRGVKVDVHDLTNSCFKGCTIFGLPYERLNQFRFSVNTFDEFVFDDKGFGYRTKMLDLEIREKFYKKLILTAKELTSLLQWVPKSKIISRYDGIDTGVKFTWVLMLEELFPNNNVVLWR